MQNLFNGLPVFNALIDDDEAGVYCVSLVDESYNATYQPLYLEL